MAFNRGGLLGIFRRRWVLGVEVVQLVSGHPLARNGKGLDLLHRCTCMACTTQTYDRNVIKIEWCHSHK